ncbi:predicted protein [Histoplasma capsulatum H143]|uniref:Uncharacterized protein n=1 Tax=Ajellomyces capsulatus (strain H143) TaxID=544712 RepID=C6H4E1_AJECH|nr:predicted protein [Histoplasma capsulatum H143]
MLPGHTKPGRKQIVGYDEWGAGGAVAVSKREGCFNDTPIFGACTLNQELFARERGVISARGDLLCFRNAVILVLAFATRSLDMSGKTRHTTTWERCDWEP